MQQTRSRGPAIATAVAVLAVVVATAAAVWAVDRQAAAGGSRTGCARTCGRWRRPSTCGRPTSSRGVKAVASEPRVRDAVAALVAGRPAEVETLGPDRLGHPRLHRLLRHRLRVAGGRLRRAGARRAAGALRVRPAFTARLRAEGAAITRPLPSAHPAPRRQGRRPGRRPDPVRVRLGQPRPAARAARSASASTRCARSTSC